MFTPRPSKITSAPSGSGSNEVSPLLAAELGLEYASLRAPGNCPTGMYLTPLPETLLKWYGVFFVHRGPYAGSVLRFTLSFPTSYPQSAPIIRFDSDVFHPMVDPKTKVWTARGRLTQWRPRIDHVPHLLHSLKSSFKSQSLQSITEDQAVNKQVWSLYHHSRQTFLSMTSQRALHSTSLHHLYPTAHPILSPTSPTKGDRLGVPSGPLSPTKSPPGLPPPSPTRQRTLSAQSGVSIAQTPGKGLAHKRSSSMLSAASIDEGPITFKEMGEDERGLLWAGLKKSLGEGQ